MKDLIPIERIENKIYLIRGQKVMLDRDLAELYGVEARILKQAVKRNIERFPIDFMFELNKEEFENWRSHFVMSKDVTNCDFLRGKIGLVKHITINNEQLIINNNVCLPPTHFVLRRINRRINFSASIPARLSPVEDLVRLLGQYGQI